MDGFPARAVVLYRLIVRPMFADPVRTLLTAAAVTLGVAVIVAVDLASESATGSFRSSLESLRGGARYEITQVGGIPETVYGDLVRLAEPLAFSPRVEGFALLPRTGEQVALFGMDLVGDTVLVEEGTTPRSAEYGSGTGRGTAPEEAGAAPRPGLAAPIDTSAVWVSAALGESHGGTRGLSFGDTLELIVGDRRLELEVQGVLAPSLTATGRFILMDIALAQRVLGRPGRLDRIYVYTHGRHVYAHGPFAYPGGPDSPPRGSGARPGERDVPLHDPDAALQAAGQRAPDGAGHALDRPRPHAPEQRDWRAALAPHLPPAASVLPAGTSAEDSRRMLGAFRWNLRMMSYAAILVGAFLIYNTISAWIVRRRQQIGIVRAVGASRTMVRAAFLFEGAVFGVLGVAAGLVCGRLLALAAVDTVGHTVSSLYVSSTPGEIAFRPWTIVVATVSGIGVSLLSAWWPAREAAAVAPTDAMAGTTLDYDVRAVGRRSTVAAAVLAVLAVLCCLIPPLERVPVGGYLALLCLIGAAAMASPRLSTVVLGLCGRWLAARFGIIPGLAARTLAASLGRTSVIVTAMAVATALVVGMAVMVGSFRETVVDWVEHRLRADFYVSPVGSGGRGASSTMDEAVAVRLEAVPGVLDVGRYRTYALRYRDTPATLGLADVAMYRRHSGIRFLEGPAPEAVWPRLAAGESVIVSEVFSERHAVRPGDSLRLPLGAEVAEVEVAAVFYDYSGDRGFVIGDRNGLRRYLPDARVSSVGVYLEPEADPEASHAALVRAVSGLEVAVTPVRALRERSIEIFDRTFAITYALEVIAVLVAVLGMAEALLNLVYDRRVELAQLRIHGASVRQVRALIVMQAGLLGVAACVLGLVLGVAWSQVNLLVIHKQSFGWSVPLHWPGGLLIAALGLIFLASTLSGLYPARIASRLVPVEVLRGE